MGRWIALTVAVLVAPAGALADEFSYEPPGVLVPGSGTGRVDDTVYVPGMRFPVEAAPAYPNSQVWGVGGSQGPSGSQCDPRNYSYPWHDNFCESRSWDMPLCPSGNGHQGQDIRPATCDDDLHWAVAAEDGTITSIGSYSVYLMADSGTRHRYLHMSPSSLAVREGQRVSRGDRLGRISNAFGGTPTTIHLHYDLYQQVSGVGGAYVPTYLSLVSSYEELLGVPAEPCSVLPSEGGVLDDDGPCFQQYGPPEYWRRVEGMGHGGALRWTNAWDGDRPGNWARWQVHLAEAGRYIVEVHVASAYGGSRSVPYRIRHGGEETDMVIDPSGEDGWLALGAFDFAAGGDQAVELFDNTGETADELHITADAVRLTPFLATSPDGGGISVTGIPTADGGYDEEPLPEDGHHVRATASVSGGCTAAGSTGEPHATYALALLLAGLLSRRRRR